MQASSPTPRAAAVPTLYIDLGSPYAYLAVERAPGVLGVAPRLAPVLLGVIFRHRGSGSWALTDARADRIAELEARARRYGLPAFVWPGGWPADGLLAMRAAVWAQARGRLDPFAREVLRRQFTRGADIADPAVLAAAASAAGLDGAALATEARSPEVKQALREATDAAWEAGVRGVPTLATAAGLFFGDDALEAAATALAAQAGVGARR